MPSPGMLRDSTQIILPYDILEDVREEIESRFVVTIHAHSDDSCRIIGSPVEIRALSDFLTRHGVSVR
ncbi:hypothetical protein [Haloferax sp. DFSO52]|uniref:VNG_1110C family protein n=1 Tax=Haloferax sp. DFSO52 TaxID=3388505 RepID=UPI003A8A0DAE